MCWSFYQTENYSKPAALDRVPSLSSVQAGSLPLHACASGLWWGLSDRLSTASVPLAAWIDEGTTDFFMAQWGACVRGKCDTNVIWNMKWIYHLHCRIWTFEKSLQKSDITYFVIHNQIYHVSRDLLSMHHSSNSNNSEGHHHPDVNTHAGPVCETDHNIPHSRSRSMSPYGINRP